MVHQVIYIRHLTFSSFIFFFYFLFCFIFLKQRKFFVHEWAHLRYGVFDEYGQAKDRNYPLFYRPEGTSSSIVPNLCTSKPPIFTVRYALMLFSFRQSFQLSFYGLIIGIASVKGRVRLTQKLDCTTTAASMICFLNLIQLRR